MLVDTWNVHGQVVLLSDTVRVDAYRAAIDRKVEPGDVVVDLGSGSGVLARFAALAGASRVIAVEQRAELCELNAHTNQMLGLDSVIEVVHGRAEEVRLGRQVDVLISELIGSLVDDEGMSEILASFCTTHRRDLAPDIRFVPEEVELFGRVVAGPDGREITTRAGAEAADGLRAALAGELRVLTNLEGLTMAGEPFQLLWVDGAGGRRGGHGEVVAGFEPGWLPGLPATMACWFQARLAEGVVLDSRGNSKASTSWGWPLVPLASALAPTADPAGDLELSFSLQASRVGDLNVEAWLA